MAKPKKARPRAASKPRMDPAREERIIMEIVVDAYGPDERAIGWFCYLDEALFCPFRAKCIEGRATSPLEVGEKVEVIAMGPKEECEREMFVTIRRNERELAVPLAQLKVVEADEETREAVEDWHYWVRMGYTF
jgi:hypothetical protein